MSGTGVQAMFVVSLLDASEIDSRYPGTCFVQACGITETPNNDTGTIELPFW